MKRATRAELDMFAKGYASTRMVVYKAGLSQPTVGRYLREGKFKGIQRGQQNFIEIKSVAAYFGPKTALLMRLGNWSDVFAKDQDGTLYVKEPEC